ncbi:MAG: FumA C-terminus/TtdB family hydratase beta subunit [Elusimicrobiota bacterium]
MKTIRIETPLTKEIAVTLCVGQKVLLNGAIYTARDAAHYRLVELIRAHKPLPIPLKDQIIYYVGPTPPPPGKIIGSAGPTTSSRLDPYTPYLLEQGLRGMIGKGERDEEVIKNIMKFKAIYFAATGGAGALLSQHIRAAKVTAFPALGAEAIYKLELQDFPLLVAIDTAGRSIFYR